MSLCSTLCEWWFVDDWATVQAHLHRLQKQCDRKKGRKALSESSSSSGFYPADKPIPISKFWSSHESYYIAVTSSTFGDQSGIVTFSDTTTGVSSILTTQVSSPEPHVSPVDSSTGSSIEVSEPRRKRK